ncbi:MAG: Esterase EstB [Alphaproteobacteria bacterium MarineAlpha4_Bin2]|nr:MAG: Esterase EstB [Alphaproteobacteria bacterium MarineAlpha4_Bin2]
MVQGKIGFTQIEDYLDARTQAQDIAGCSMLVMRGGKEIYSTFKGVQDLESGRPIARNTIYRIYSMTKPVASVALVMLWDRGAFGLDDPLERYLPAFADMKVYDPDGSHSSTEGKITIRHLLTHTSGLILPAFSEHPLRNVYLSRGINGSRSEGDLADVICELAKLPLLFEPGTRWEYSMATDVVGRLVEVIGSRPFEEFLREELFGPLNMVDTDFYLPRGKILRFAANYTRDGDAPIRLIDSPEASRYLNIPEYKSGNGGLLSTMDDYLQFCLMLRNRGTLGGVQILKEETVDLMTRNHLDGDMADMDAAEFGGLDWHGMGFGLGFSVVLKPIRVGYGNVGIYGWSGAASTYFWIDPIDDLIAIFFTQLCRLAPIQYEVTCDPWSTIH